ncbi:MAG TPA: RNA polymerase sigma factor [Chthoniobacterales bacterium]|nr:RNA polymerase sigma factor [Chthoniobacterales bacterium]
MQQNFADNVAQHLPFLNRLVCRATRGDHISEDIVQATVLKALVHADQFRFESTLKTWLSSIAMNEVCQAYRCSWRKRTVPLITENLDAHRSHPVDLPNKRYEAKEREVLLRQAVYRLPRSYRCVIELCDFENLSMNEAAAKLGLTLSTVKTRLNRARKKLRPIVAKLDLKAPK